MSSYFLNHGISLYCHDKVLVESVKPFIAGSTHLFNLIK